MSRYNTSHPHDPEPNYGFAADRHCHHLHALATPWLPQECTDVSYAAGPSSTPLAHYAQVGSSSLALHPSIATPVCSPGYPQAQLHGWENQIGGSPGFPLSSTDVYGNLRRPHDHQIAGTAYENPLTSQHYHFRPSEQTHLPASHLAQSTAQAAPLRIEAPHELSQHHAVWQPPQQFSGHISTLLSDSIVASSQRLPSVQSWSVGSSDILSTDGQIWSFVQVPHALRVPTPVHATSVSDGLSDQTSSSLEPPARKKNAKVPSSFVQRQEKVKVSKRKGPLKEKQREKTHTMRKTKRICVRCRFYKAGCDEGDPCERCEKISGHARSFREPCYREHLEDTSLVRRCNGREHQEEAEFLEYEWISNSQLYEMDVLWNLPGFGPIRNAQPIRVTFRSYSPNRGPLDVATSVWLNKNGEIQKPNQPAYAIYDIARLIPVYERYFYNLQPDMEEWIFSRVQQDEVALLTYQEVVRMRNLTQSKALDLAMRLQCISVVSQGYGSVWSDNIPGIREYDYSRLGHSDYEAYDRNSRDRPLPGAMNHQLDVAAVKYLIRLEKAFVRELALLIFKPKIKPWYELFLALYVIFWNLEYIRHGAEAYIESKVGTNQIRNVVTTQIRKWEFAFPVLLYHWRCILRGYSPFKVAKDDPEELKERGHVDLEGFQYVTKVTRLFDNLKSDRFQPPVIGGHTTTPWSMSSPWIMKLFQEAGA